MSPAITTAEMIKDFENGLTYGQPIRIRRFTETFNSGSYDDDVILTSGVDTWTTGLHFPVAGVPSTSDGFSQQFGRQLKGDIFMFIKGDILTSGSFRIGLGSPPSSEFEVVEDGVQNWDWAGGTVYKILDLSHLTTGSLIGEQ